MSDELFHEGEVAVQERTGERAIARRHAGIISRVIAPAARSFLARQRLLALSASRDDGHVWASVWCGDDGFVHSADGERVTIRRSLAAICAGDPVLNALAIGRDVGMLAIELASRRRLRINGTVRRISKETIEIAVRESVPNCPKYIQRRLLEAGATAPAGGPGEWGRIVDDRRRALVEQVDTAFVGSFHPARGADVSHRGGAPGFIQVVDDETLRVPDYPGNSMFMTLGNFAVDPRASLAVLDFPHRRIVSFSGSARLHFGAERPDHPTGGTGRYWDLRVREWIEFELPAALRWVLADASPFNPPPR
jgi:predicted pyridoxine 5'-phosphate oxidase superfamily flavin-nucleotide-binding protein